MCGKCMPHWHSFEANVYSLEDVKSYWTSSNFIGCCQCCCCNGYCWQCEAISTWYLYNLHWITQCILARIWVRSRKCRCLVPWFCYQVIAKPNNKTAAPSWKMIIQKNKNKITFLSTSQGINRVGLGNFNPRMIGLYLQNWNVAITNELR